jgi:hypothetical protein
MPGRNTFMLLIASLCCILLYCKKQDHITGGSSCKASAADSSFRIEELIGFNEKKFFETDTVVNSRNPIYLNANDTTADEYLWNFDIDPRTFTGKSVAFSIDQPAGIIKITLTQKRSGSNACAGLLPSEIQFVKYLTVVDGSANPLIGNYYGYNQSDKNKFFTISILQNGLKNLPFTTSGNYYLQNEIIYGSTAFYIAGSGTYDPGYGAYATEGFGYIKKDNRLEIDYTYKLPSANGFIITKDTFYGIKQ